MSGVLSHFACCFWWFLLGILLGWLLNRWLCSCSCAKKSNKEVSPDALEKTSESSSESAKNTKSSSTSASKANAQSLVSANASKPAAKKSVSGASFDAAAAKAAGFSIKKADDLTVIEGIGPKISELFKQNGIVTFDDLSKQSVDNMRKVLDLGGARFRIANPSTWAKQAALAANNEWAALKKLQDELSGGIKK
jgi:predicted flap endonuclease-1-like 5' DNA nuclease